MEFDFLVVVVCGAVVHFTDGAHRCRQPFVGVVTLLGLKKGQGMGS